MKQFLFVLSCFLLCSSQIKAQDLALSTSMKNQNIEVKFGILKGQTIILKKGYRFLVYLEDSSGFNIKPKLVLQNSGVGLTTKTYKVQQMLPGFKAEMLLVVQLDTPIYLSGSGAFSFFEVELPNKENKVLVRMYGNYVKKMNGSDSSKIRHIPNQTKGLWVDASRTPSAKGVKTEGFGSQDLNYGINIQTGLVAMLWDADKLKRISLDTNILKPASPWGNKWSTVGYNSDYQIYYTFEMKDSTERVRFKTLLKNIPECTYLSLFSFNTVSVNDVDQETESLLEANGLKGMNQPNTDYSKHNGALSYAMINAPYKGEGVESINTDIDAGAYVATSTIIHSLYNNCHTDTAALLQDEKVISISKTSSVNEVEQIKKLGVYPNPYKISGLVSLQSMDESIVKIEVYSIYGAKVMQLDNPTKQFTLTGINLPGIYILRIKTVSNKIFQTKLVAER